MYKVKVIGAGSIGNHLTHGCRRKGWSVTMCDIDKDALERTKNDIYPARYSAWDQEIRLATCQEVENEKFDLVIIGTPPEYHIGLAIEAIKKNDPKAILVEKPFCTPSLDRCIELYDLAKTAGVFVGVGYNHVVADNTLFAEKVLSGNSIGKPLAINVRWLEHWGGIFGAHPWLAGPHDSYLGFAMRGGGACGEHSHAINIWQHVAHLLDMGKVIEVTASMDMVTNDKVDYDQTAQLSLRTEKGLFGSVIQDVITEPPIKSLRVQGEDGYVEWFANYVSGQDAVFYDTKSCNTSEEKLISKTRPDDFKGEIDHIGSILEGKIAAQDSPLSIERGLDTMLVIAAAFKSNAEKRTVKIDYNAGYSLNAVL